MICPNVGIDEKSPIKESKRLFRHVFKTKYSMENLLKSLSFFGLHVTEDIANYSKCKRILRLIHTSLVLTCLHYWCALYLSYFFRNQGNWKTFNIMLVTWMSTGTYDAFLFQKRKIKFFVEVFSFDRTIPLSKKDKQAFVKMCKIVNISVWIYIILYCAIYLAIPTKLEPTEYFSAVFQDYFQSNTSREVGKYMIQVCEAYICLLVQGSLTFVIGFYIVAIWASSLWFKGLDRLTGKFMTSTNFRNVKYFRKAYDIVIQRIQVLDNAFSFSAMFWFLVVVITICFRIIAILADNSTSASSDIQGMLIIGFGLFRGVFIILIGISFSAQWLTDTAKNSVLILEIWLESMQSYLVYEEICIILHMFEMKPPVVTLWHFTPLGKPFLMSCLQTIVTYVIICLQMTPFGKDAIHV